MSLRETLREIFYSSDSDYAGYLKKSWDITRQYHGWQINFYAPSILKYDVAGFNSPTAGIFQSVSVTGKECSLMCEHCKGKLLESMHSATNPEALLDLGKKLSYRGCRGLLISGGSNRDGSVPLRPFIDAIRRLHKDLKMKIAVHTGLIDQETATMLKKAGVDSAMLDIIGDRDTIRNIYHLDKTPADFERSLVSLVKAGLKVSPHIVVGLNKGEIVGELEALETISRSKVENIVIVAFKSLEPDSGNQKVASPLQIGKLITAARIINPHKKILLGCARPPGQHKIKTDIISLKAGVNGIAFPTREAIILSDKLHLNRNFIPYCCSFI